MKMAENTKSAWALEFGRRLLDRRRELRLSQQEVADRAGIHRTLLSDYERDAAPERVPTDVTLRGLAKALEVDEQTMFAWAQVRFPQVSTSANNHAPAEVVDAVMKLADEFRQLLGDVMDRLERLENPPGSPRRRTPKR